MNSFFKFFGIKLPHSARQMNPSQLFRYFLKDYKNFLLSSIAKGGAIWGSSLSIHIVRPLLHRWRGCKIASGVAIGEDVILGLSDPSQIQIEEGVWITARCILLEHQRDLSSLDRMSTIHDCDHKFAKILIKKNAHIGVGSIILPGIIIGEGAIIGAGSLVNKNIPDFVVAAGNPIKIIRELPVRVKS